MSAQSAEVQVIHGLEDVNGLLHWMRLKAGCRQTIRSLSTFEKARRRSARFHILNQVLQTSGLSASYICANAHSILAKSQTSLLLRLMISLASLNSDMSASLVAVELEVEGLIVHGVSHVLDRSADLFDGHLPQHAATNLLEHHLG